MKGELHVSMAFIIATLCNVNAFESYPLPLYRERTPKFRKRSKRSQVCNLARCGWHNMAAHKHHHKPPWFCTGGVYSRGEGGGGRCREGEVKGCVLSFRIATWRVTSCAPRCVLLLSKRCFCARGVWTFFYLFVVGQFKNYSGLINIWKKNSNEGLDRGRC